MLRVLLGVGGASLRSVKQDSLRVICQVNSDNNIPWTHPLLHVSEGLIRVEVLQANMQCSGLGEKLIQ